jgi:PleD family two-component response regulator
MDQDWILLIDPFKNLLNAYRMILEEEKYLVETAGTIEDAYLLFDKRSYSVVLLEYLPPFELFQKMIQWIKEKSSETYILVVTNATIDEKIYERLFDIGVDDFILKPYAPQKIIIHIKKGLRQREVNIKANQLEKLNLLDPIARNIEELIFSKIFLKRCLRQELKKSIRHCHPFSILLIQIPAKEKGGERYDNFYGELARRIRKFIREEDLMIKNNGEIALLLPDTNQMGSQALGGRLSNLIRNDPSWISDDLLKTMVQASSIQCFTYPDQFDLPEPLGGVVQEIQKEYPRQ